MHRYRASVTCAPNFAFALVQRKTSEALRDSMDLSCIQYVREPLVACLLVCLSIVFEQANPNRNNRQHENRVGHSSLPPILHTLTTPPPNPNQPGA
jgi:hypothetical protein